MKHASLAKRIIAQLADRGGTPPNTTIAAGSVINQWLGLIHGSDAGAYDPAKSYMVTPRGIFEFKG